MRTFLALIGLSAPLALAACGGSSTPSTELGSVTIGTHSVAVTLEGSGAPGKESEYAIKPTNGSAKPDAVTCGWGTSATAATQAIAVYDPAAGDFDCFATRSSDGGGALWIALTYGATTDTGSIVVP